MKKQILNIGKILNKSEQKEISGGLSYLTKKDGTKAKGESCTKGSSYPAYSCKSGLDCIGTSNSIGVCK